MVSYYLSNSGLADLITENDVLVHPNILAEATGSMQTAGA